MKRAITLRKFIECFNIKSYDIKLSSNIPENFKNLTYSEKYNLCKRELYDLVEVLSVNDGKIFFCIKRKQVKRVGKVFYIKCINDSYVYITPEKIIISGDCAAPKRFLDVCKLNMFYDLPSKMNIFLYKPSIYRGILTGRIYNQETLYKAIASNCWKMKNISWKTVKLFLSNCPLSISMIDLNTFTKNVDQSVNRIVTDPDNYGLYIDLLHSAIQLNEVVDFSWSIKRIYIEHQRQVRELLKFEIAHKSSLPVYKHVFELPNVKQLNTELDVFMEGQTMHHCLYSCYWQQIQNHTYIAFHMTSPEDCTFGVRLNDNGNAYLDQIFLKYDRPVLASTRELAESFISKINEKLRLMLKQREYKYEILPNLPF